MEQMPAHPQAMKNVIALLVIGDITAGASERLFGGQRIHAHAKEGDAAQAEGA